MFFSEVHRHWPESEVEVTMAECFHLIICICPVASGNGQTSVCPSGNGIPLEVREFKGAKVTLLMRTYPDRLFY